MLVRAHATYPNDPEIMERLGVTYVFEGRDQEGVDLMERVLKVDPFHRRAIYSFMARGYVVLKNYHRTGELVSLCQAETSTYRRCYEAAVVYHVETGNMEKARAAADTLHRLDPAFTLATGVCGHDQALLEATQCENAISH